jgi:hypothetical protein
VKRFLCLVVSLLLFASAAVLAQRSGEHRANAGRIPPSPAATNNPNLTREAERLPDGSLDPRQHVNNDHWFGHDAPIDPRYHLDHPWEHGRLEHSGAAFQYRIGGVDAATHRFWFSNRASFEIPAWQWPLAADWCWSCADDYVVYEDPDHPGWYLLYSMETGAYVHAQYLGSH